MSSRPLTTAALFSTRTGVRQLARRRVALFDVGAIAAWRQELIAAGGVVAAQRQMLKLGYRQGWYAADSMVTVANSLPNPPPSSIVGELLTALGMVRQVDTSDAESEPWTLMFHGAFEADEHVRRSGPGSDSACWFVSGLVAGYFSRSLGQAVVCREDLCVGRGDPMCRVHVHLLPQSLDPAVEAAVESGCAELLTALGFDETVIARGSEGRRASRSLPGIRSPRMRAVIAEAEQAADVDATVLITGESGVGKTQLARYIHDQSRRARAAFVSLNCGAIPETLIESELFGHRRGAFTGALEDRVGLFEAANGGTIFLDEIGELATPVQVKLLHVLQSREVRRVGDTRSRPVGVRVIAATNRDLSADVASGRFRDDLYYRLDVIRFHVPPLRERVEDLRMLIDLFLSDAAARMRKQVVGYTASALDRLLAYHWPGNIRELENVIERMCALSTGRPLDLDDLPSHIRDIRPARPSPVAPSIRPLRDVEREHILMVLQQCRGNKTHAAAALGITQDTLYRKLKQYRLAELSD